MQNQLDPFQTVILELSEFNRSLTETVSTITKPTFEFTNEDVKAFSDKRVEILGLDSINKRLSEEQYNRIFHITRIDLVSPLYLEVLGHAVNYEKKSLLGRKKHSDCIDFVLDSVTNFDSFKQYLKGPDYDSATLVELMDLQVETSQIVFRATEAYMFYQRASIAYEEAVDRFVNVLKGLVSRLSRISNYNKNLKVYFSEYIGKFSEFIEHVERSH